MYTINKFSSPFIEERLYLMVLDNMMNEIDKCSRPLLSRSGCIFKRFKYGAKTKTGSRPLLSRSGCIYLTFIDMVRMQIVFSSPFIEERLYLSGIYEDIYNTETSSRPLLSRSGCILPFGTYVSNIRGSRPLLSRSGCI